MPLFEIVQGRHLWRKEKILLVFALRSVSQTMGCPLSEFHVHFMQGTRDTAEPIARKRGL